MNPRLAVFFLFGAVFCARADIFVAPNGSDQSDGSEAKPFATLERARDVARNSKQSASIFLRAGDYVRTNSLELTAADSNITWRPHANERVRFLGGQKLPPFSKITDPAILARLNEKARDHALQLNLRQLGIHDFGEMKS